MRDILIIILIIVMVLLNVAVFLYNDQTRKKERIVRQAEENKLILQQKRYQLVIDNSKEMIYEISLLGEACISSERIREKFGWSIPEQVENATVDSLLAVLHVHPEDQQEVKTALIRMIDENQSSESLLRIQDVQGTYLWCKVTYYPLRDADNILVSIVGKIEDVDQEVRERERLAMESRLDGLTGLINKKTFQEETAKFLREHSAKESAIVFIDLDHFKRVNDTLGHSMGDQAIRDAAKKLQVIFANVDLVARFGGDEFCAFVKEIPRDTMLDKLNWAVDKLKGNYSNGQASVPVTASLGAVYCQCEEADFQTLLDVADKALYQAKAEGRNRFILQDFEG